jgi:DNA helicase-2/ATP-dependent DNA helicase PcrA
MGKTYDSADSIAEFFKQRSRQLGEIPSKRDQGLSRSEVPSRSAPRSQGAAASPTSASGDFVPGSYVRHSKYGRGLVLRREGAGESTKLTVSFPGYGQKKLVEKYAGLEKA